VLPRSQGRRNLEASDGAASVLPNIHQFLPTFAGWHSMRPIVARGSLEASMERAEAQVFGVPLDGRLRTREPQRARSYLSGFAPSATR
jgi:hypothetical protein